MKVASHNFLPNQCGGAVGAESDLDETSQTSQFRMKKSESLKIATLTGPIKALVADQQIKVVFHNCGLLPWRDLKVVAMEMTLGRCKSELNAVISLLWWCICTNISKWKHAKGAFSDRSFKYYAWGLKNSIKSSHFKSYMRPWLLKILFQTPLLNNSLVMVVELNHILNWMIFLLTGWDRRVWWWSTSHVLQLTGHPCAKYDNGDIEFCNLLTQELSYFKGALWTGAL